MVKWKKLNRKMAGFMLGVMMLFTASTTAFAYVDESADNDEVLPENTDSTSTGMTFSTPGNGKVKDDITDSSSKESKADIIIL